MLPAWLLTSYFIFPRAIHQSFWFWLPGMTLFQELEVQGKAWASGLAGLLLSSLPVPLSALWPWFLAFTFPPTAQDRLWQGQADFCSLWGLLLHCLSSWNLLGWHEEAEQLNSKHSKWRYGTLEYSIYWGWGSSAHSLYCPAECNKTCLRMSWEQLFLQEAQPPTATSLLCGGSLCMGLSLPESSLRASPFPPPPQCAVKLRLPSFAAPPLLCTMALV